MTSGMSASPSAWLLAFTWSAAEFEGRAVPVNSCVADSHAAFGLTYVGKGKECVGKARIDMLVQTRALCTWEHCSVPHRSPGSPHCPCNWQATGYNSHPCIALHSSVAIKATMAGRGGSSSHATKELPLPQHFVTPETLRLVCSRTRPYGITLKYGSTSCVAPDISCQISCQQHQEQQLHDSGHAGLMVKACCMVSECMHSMLCNTCKSAVPCPPSFTQCMQGVQSLHKLMGELKVAAWVRHSGTISLSPSCWYCVQVAKHAARPALARVGFRRR